MEQMNPTDTATEVAAPTDEEMPESQGIDGIIAKVDSYIAKPELVTPETLADLKMDLEDLKSVLEPEGGETPSPSGAPEGGLAAMIGGGR